MAEAICLSDLLHLRSGIGDGNKAAARFVGANGLFHALEEILLENIRLQRGAGLAGNNEQSLRKI